MKQLLSIIFCFALTCSFCFGDTTIVAKAPKSDSMVFKIQLPISEQHKADVKYFGFTLEEWKTLAAVIIPLLVLLITNLVTLGKIRKETKESVRRELIVTIIKNKKERLEKFYDPIIALLSVNENIFNSFGPKSFPTDEIKRQVATTLWHEMRTSIIVSNNSKISDTIKSFSHLIFASDSMTKYLEFVRHAESYNHFVKFPTERHEGFSYPTDILSNAINKRQEIINEIQAIENGLLEIINQLKK